ncbi:phosphopentomutase [Secundilactobacillus kimchicus JCM 15530]|uniref:Phosphopentomutase n=2 Tax=Secundilactobacillus kimchicus TaxID=528209 RepID=A0A0R1HL96_9LACO|nr:hypothetical protein [Secundilactobacillus kimchicus]KRK47485.1 phosphopentomutase [Secundilactobacillus kimchicus JCM 15530]
MPDHIVIVDLFATGFGEAPEANRYDSVGADGLGHTASSVPEFSVPTMQRWGLGNVRFNHPIAGIEPVDSALGYFGRVHVETTNWNQDTGFAELWQGDADRTLHQVSQFASVQLISAMPVDRISFPVLLVDDDRAGFEMVRSADQNVQYLRLGSGLTHSLRGDVGGFATWLEWVDHELATLSEQLSPDDWLIVTSSVATDPTLGRFTREYVPLLIEVKGQGTGQALGIRRTLADVSASIMATVTPLVPAMGHPFLTELGLVDHHMDGD